MHPPWHGSPMASHSNEVERRLVTSETKLESHEKRISYLERIMHGLIAGVTMLASGKSGDIAQILTSLLTGGKP